MEKKFKVKLNGTYDTVYADTFIITSSGTLLFKDYMAENVIAFASGVWERVYKE